jgi:hypothetical protein
MLAAAAVLPIKLSTVNTASKQMHLMPKGGQVMTLPR